MYNIIDTHSHLFAEEFGEDRTEVMRRAMEAGITRIVMPNIDASSIGPMLQVCAEYPSLCFPTIGLHPTEVKKDFRQVLASMKEQLDKSARGKACHAPFVAIGEVGLDFYWDTTYKTEQRSALEEQVTWALEYDLPIMRVQHFSDVSEDPQAWANDYLERVEFANGNVDIMPSSPIEMESLGKLKTTPAPAIGANTEEILRELGYSPEEREKLLASGGAK